MHNFKTLVEDKTYHCHIGESQNYSVPEIESHHLGDDQKCDGCEKKTSKCVESEEEEEDGDGTNLEDWVYYVDGWSQSW